MFNRSSALLAACILLVAVATGPTVAEAGGKPKIKQVFTEFGPPDTLLIVGSNFGCGGGEPTKYSLDVTVCTKHANDLDPVLSRPVEDDVPFDRKATKTRRQILAGGSHHWKVGENLALLAKKIEEPIRRRHAVFRYGVPDLQEIQLRQIRAEDLTHGAQGGAAGGPSS